MPNAETPIEVFCSYAHEDETWLQQLKKHLSMLTKQNIINTWHDRQIRPGANWEQEIDARLNSASIILLLISADFLDSDYCTGVEMSRALERHGKGEARVIPIMLRHVDWQGAPFAGLQMLPKDARPVNDWADHDLAFKDIAIGLRAVVEEIQALKALQGKISLYQGAPVQRNNLFLPQIGSTNDHVYQFRHCQEKVSELKKVHDMLHEIEVQLEVLSATVQRVVREQINQHPPDFDSIENIWEQAVVKLDYLTYFATKEMKILEKERFSFDNDVIRGGGPWVKDLFILQRYFEIEVVGRNIGALHKLSKDMLTKCRSHLYQIDKRLLGAVEELDDASNLIVRNRT